MQSRALVLAEPRQLEQRVLPVPEIGDDDGLLRVEACGLCGTDHEQFTGAIPVFAPYVPGHEIVGVIEAVGGRAAEAVGRTGRPARRRRSVHVVPRVRRLRRR